MVLIRSVSKRDNTHVILLLGFYEKINTMIFKLLGSVLNFIVYNHLCDYYLFLEQEKLPFARRGF